MRPGSPLPRGCWKISSRRPLRTAAPRGRGSTGRHPPPPCRPSYTRAPAAHRATAWLGDHGGHLSPPCHPAPAGAPAIAPLPDPAARFVRPACSPLRRPCCPFAAPVAPSPLRTIRLPCADPTGCPFAAPVAPSPPLGHTPSRSSPPAMRPGGGEGGAVRRRAGAIGAAPSPCTVWPFRAAHAAPAHSPASFAPACRTTTRSMHHGRPPLPPPHRPASACARRPVLGGAGRTCAHAPGAAAPVVHVPEGPRRGPGAAAAAAAGRGD